MTASRCRRPSTRTRWLRDGRRGRSAVSSSDGSHPHRQRGPRVAHLGREWCDAGPSPRQRSRRQVSAVGGIGAHGWRGVLRRAVVGVDTRRRASAHCTAPMATLAGRGRARDVASCWARAGSLHLVACVRHGTSSARARRRHRAYVAERDGGARRVARARLPAAPARAAGGRRARRWRESAAHWRAARESAGGSRSARGRSPSGSAAAMGRARR